MDVFAKLGIDKTIFFQFVTFLISYIVLKKLLFDKLRDNLEYREEKTTRLEQKANEKFEEARMMAENYQTEIDKAENKAQEHFNNSKKIIIESENNNFSNEEKLLLEEFENEKQQYQSFISEKKKSILLNSKELSEALLKKLEQN